MSELTITIPETTLLALHATPEEAGARLRLAAAIKLYEIGQLSSGGGSATGWHPAHAFSDQTGR